MLSKRNLLKCTIIGALAASMFSIAQAQDSQKVLRVAPQADLKILDPIWTTAFVTRNHGYMVYDTLFGVDEQGVPKPQMVDTFTTSDDGKTWNFTLRKGLKFHDGAPVTGEDVVASIKRWGARDGLGQRMMGAMDTMEATGADGFKMVFKEPFGMVLEALSKPSSNPPFIMPARVAATPPDKQIDDTTGSGPYVFNKAGYRPGEIVVYDKFKDYVSRDEPPSGTAGGKPVFVDRMEWVILKDAQTQANALANGEIDMIEWVPTEQYTVLEKNPKITLEQQLPKSSYAMHLNHIIPPFDNPKIAQAAIMAINQEALMRAQLVHKDLYNRCASIYACDSQFASDETGYFTGMPQFDKAKALLKEAGYDGTPVVLMYPTDFAVLNKFPPVLSQLLQQAGFKVDMQSMDWPTLVTRRAKKDPADQGGWNVFITGWGASDTMNPMFFAPMTGNGEKGWFGWTTDPKLEELKSAFMVETDAAKKKALATDIQKQVFETGILAPVGEYKQFTAYRTGVVDGVVKAPVPVFWNLKKN